MTDPTWRVLVLAPYFTPARRAGGPVRTLTALLDAAPAGIDIDIITRARDHGGPMPVPVPTDSWVRRSRHRVLYAGSILSAVRQTVITPADLVYVNSFFDPALSLLPQLVVRLLRPSRRILIAPRGELSPGALKQNSLKKAVFIRLYRAVGMHRRVLWHASSDREAAEIRAVFGPLLRILVRENETSLPDRATPPAVRDGGPLRVVFLSRIVPKKGLDVLLRALALVDGPVEVAVRGTEEDVNYVRKCRWLADRSGKAVTFHGPVEPEHVRDALAAADVMLLPTASENFGHVVAEALSVSCPVVLPDTTPWTPLLRAGAGAVVDGHDPAAWAEVLVEWQGLDVASRLRRRQAAGEAYGRWKRGDRPAHVFTLARSVMDAPH